MLYVLCAQFDFRYLHGRSLVLVDDETGDSRVDLSRLGRALTGGGKLRERELNSGAYGQNKFCTLDVPGQLNLDLLQVMRREHKLDAYRFVRPFAGQSIARTAAVTMAATMTATSPGGGGRGGPVMRTRTSMSRDSCVSRRMSRRMSRPP